MSLTAGYRRDDLRWRIAGNLQGTSPDTQSELEWSDVDIYQLKLVNRSVILDRIYLRWQVAYGVVDAGDNRDSDYHGDNRTQEYSRSLNGVDGNKVWDASLGIGPRFSFSSATLALCPMIGYAVSEQDLTIVDGNQVLTDNLVDRPLGPIDGLDSRYETRWQGPWLGLDLHYAVPLSYGIFTGLGIVLSAEYHWIDYDADANWNLRSEYRHPKSFTHTADGSGWVAGATILIDMDRRWQVSFAVNTTHMRTEAGVDRIYLTDGTTAETQLNEVRWRSICVEAGVSCRF